MTQPTLDSILLAFAQQAQELPADLNWEQAICAIANRLVESTPLDNDVYALLVTAACLMYRQASKEVESKQLAQGMLDRIQKNLQL